MALLSPVHMAPPNFILHKALFRRMAFLLRAIWTLLIQHPYSTTKQIWLLNSWPPRPAYCVVGFFFRVGAKWNNIEPMSLTFDSCLIRASLNLIGVKLLCLCGGGSAGNAFGLSSVVSRSSFG